MNTPLLLASCLWGLALLASFVGWGRWVAAALRVGARTYLGLELAWGFALTLALGGWVCWLGIATRPVLVALVGVGLAGLLRKSEGERVLRGAASCPRLAALGAFCAATLSLVYAIGLFDPRYQLADDFGAYFLHARQIVETGTLHEPFSLRRMASYGGQSLLHALLLVVAPVERLNLLDRGVARVGVGLIVLSAALYGRHRSLLAALLAVYVVGAYEEPILNTASISTGMLAFAGLWLTLDASRRAPETPVANGVLSGLTAAAVLSLRQNYFLACGVIVFLEHASRLRATRDPRQPKELAVAAACLLVGAGGWALLQLRSTGTALYPLLRGFANPGWDGVLSARSLDDFAASVGKFLERQEFLLLMGLCALALLLRSRARDEASLRALAGAAIVAAGTQLALFAHVNQDDLLRYSIAFVLPAVLFAALRAAPALEPPRARAGLREPSTWIAAAFLITLLVFLPPATQLSSRWATLQRSVEVVHDFAPAKRQAARLQSHAPAGAKLLVMLDEPFLLDLRRNEIASLDLPGAASPPPGLHRIRSPEDAASYFLALGYPWLAAARPSRSTGLYNLRQWTAHARGTQMPWHAHRSDAAAWRVMGLTVVGFFRILDEITRNCPSTYADDERVMIDLAHCRFPRTRP
jgi:hypothetical protein